MLFHLKDQAIADGVLVWSTPVQKPIQYSEEERRVAEDIEKERAAAAAAEAAAAEAAAEAQRQAALGKPECLKTGQATNLEFSIGLSCT
jgi:hypothetical protein